MESLSDSSLFADTTTEPFSSWRAELRWFLRAACWSLLGTTIVYGVFLFRMGPDYFASSEDPARSYRWWEYVLVPLAGLFDPFGLLILFGVAVLATLSARVFVRHRNLARCTLFSAACLLAFVIRVEVSRYAIPPLPEYFIVLWAAMLCCRIWPGRFFSARENALRG